MLVLNDIVLLLQMMKTPLMRKIWNGVLEIGLQPRVLLNTLNFLM